MRSVFVQVYQPEGPDGTAKIFLSYSAIFADGNALSLLLPYSGAPMTFDAASSPIGGDGVMWSLNGDVDMFSTRGTLRVEPTEEGIAVHMFALVLATPVAGKDPIVIDAGSIEGVLERRCLLGKPNVDGLTGPNGAAIEYEVDPTWNSEFCSQYR